VFPCNVTSVPLQLVFPCNVTSVPLQLVFPCKPLQCVRLDELSLVFPCRQAVCSADTCADITSASSPCFATLLLLLLRTLRKRALLLLRTLVFVRVS
jgi:hypothetical protein